MIDAEKVDKGLEACTTAAIGCKAARIGAAAVAV